MHVNVYIASLCICDGIATKFKAMISMSNNLSSMSQKVSPIRITRCTVHCKEVCREAVLHQEVFEV